jgi:hypothetical protein
MPPFRRSLSLLRLLNDCRLQPGQHPGIAHVKRHQPAASGDVPQRQLGLQRYETAWMMASRIATSYGQPRTRSAMGRSGSRRDLG